MTRQQRALAQALLMTAVCLVITLNASAQSMRSLEMDAEALAISVPWNMPVAAVDVREENRTALLIARNGTIWEWRNGFAEAQIVAMLNISPLLSGALANETTFVAVHERMVTGYHYPSGRGPLFSFPIDEVKFVEKDDPDILAIHTVRGIVGFDLRTLSMVAIPSLPSEYRMASYGKGMTAWCDDNHTVFRDTSNGPEVLQEYDTVISLSVDRGSLAVLARVGDSTSNRYLVEIFLPNGTVHRTEFNEDQAVGPYKVILRGATFAVARKDRSGLWFLDVRSFSHPTLPIEYWVRWDNNVNGKWSPRPELLEWHRLANHQYMQTRRSSGGEDGGSSAYARTLASSNFTVSRFKYPASFDVTRADDRSLWVTMRIPKTIYLDPNLVPKLQFYRFDLITQELTEMDDWGLTWDNEVRDMYGFNGGVVVRCSSDKVYRIDTGGVELRFEQDIVGWKALRRGLYVRTWTPGPPQSTTNSYYSSDGFRTWRAIRIRNGVIGLDDRVNIVTGHSVFQRNPMIQNEEHIYPTPKPFKPFSANLYRHRVDGPYADWCCYTMLVTDPDTTQTSAWIYDLNADQVTSFDLVHPTYGPIVGEVRVPRLERFLGRWSQGSKAGWLLTDGQNWEFTDTTRLADSDSVIMVSDHLLIAIPGRRNYWVVTLKPTVTSVAEEAPVQRTPGHPAIRAHESYAWHHDLVNAEVTVWDVNGRQRMNAVLESADDSSRVQIGDRGLFLLRASTGRSTRTQILMVY